MFRDSISSFPTSGNDSESIISGKSPSEPVVHAVKPPMTSPSPLLDFTFDRTSNPLRIDEDFSNKSIDNNDRSDPNDSSSSSSSSSDDQVANPIDANNNTKLNKRNRSSTTTKSSISSSSPLLDHSIDSSSFTGDEIEHHLEEKERTDSDDGIVFLHDEKKSSSHSPPPTQSRSLLERKKCTNNEKESPPTYFYFVMELCQPESLRDRLIHRSVSRPQAWLIFDQIIKGIEYIHSQKLVDIRGHAEVKDLFDVRSSRFIVIWNHRIFFSHWITRWRLATSVSCRPSGKTNWRRRRSVTRTNGTSLNRWKQARPSVKAAEITRSAGPYYTWVQNKWVSWIDWTERREIIYS